MKKIERSDIEYKIYSIYLTTPATASQDTKQSVQLMVDIFWTMQQDINKLIDIANGPDIETKAP